MKIETIFEKFEANSAYAFSTIYDSYPETRIAHFLTYDEEGLYFQTMKVKPFYKQLITTNKVAAVSMAARVAPVEHDEEGLSTFPPGYFIKVSGDVKELSFEEVRVKAEKDERFKGMVKDIERYPTMTTFVLYRFRGEVFDYDFEKTHRDHKVLRERFTFGGMEPEPAGFTITDECIACGACAEACTFDAIVPGEKYQINGARCDECGSCYSVCPVNAVIPKHAMTEAERKDAGKKIRSYMKNSK